MQGEGFPAQPSACSGGPPTWPATWQERVCVGLPMACEWGGVQPVRPPLTQVLSLSWSHETSDCRQLVVSSELRGDVEEGWWPTWSSQGSQQVPTSMRAYILRNGKDWSSGTTAGPKRERLVLAVQACSPEASSLHVLLHPSLPGPQSPPPPLA